MKLYSYKYTRPRDMVINPCEPRSGFIVESSLGFFTTDNKDNTIHNSKFYTTYEELVATRFSKTYTSELEIVELK